MLKDFLKKNITSQAKYVDYGYGQVEPNRLSAQYTGQIYAQLPAAADIKVLEQGQFVKYNYASGAEEGQSPIGQVDFKGAGEWMLVYNEIKLYRDVPGLNGQQMDCEFAMIKDNYQARIYSPFGYAVDKNGHPVVDEVMDRQARFLNGEDSEGNKSMTLTYSADRVSESEDGLHFTIGNAIYDADVVKKNEDGTYTVTYAFDDVTEGPDMYELHYEENPGKFFGPYREQKMPAGTTMVPRVFKTNVGDIFTTNTINETELAIGELLTPQAADGILAKEGAKDADMIWQVVKVYTMPDHQKGVKVMRIK